ncbi:hypothetical protein O6H91_20G054100 [Diphasiastrum complanatum]|uniref:Uncharacterized protein n=1 Tax=Diphasiastrum complanatum TaxID=34168 RepID=A0ACC2AQC8_DIPCM|nr:hypothetical protein O6H91_20G054100 [Diphasiastrum complanatum]
MGFNEDSGEPMEVDSMGVEDDQLRAGKQQHIFPGQSSKLRQSFRGESSKSKYFVGGDNSKSKPAHQLQKGTRLEGKSRRKCVRKKRSNLGDESGEGESDRPPRKRRQNHRGLEYVLDEADVGGSDEEDEENAYYKEFSSERGKNVDNTGNTEKFYRPDPLSDNSEKDDDEEERQVYQHAQTSKHLENDHESTDSEDDVTISEGDPVLYMVKCQRGHELEAAVCLMQKYIDLKAVGKSLQILSAVALEHQKGCIYVEANNEAYVKQACRGLQMIHSFRITVVPSSERVGVLSAVKSVHIHRDNWVRLKMGNYKGDLGKVLDVDNMKQRITVKLVPRIDLQEVRARMLEKEASKCRRTRSRPLQRFISIDEVKRMDIPVKCKRDKTGCGFVEEFAGIEIQDGYHVKKFSLKSVETQDVIPTLDELQKFQKPGRAIPSETLLMRQSLTARAMRQFAKGDAVVAGQSGSQKVVGFVVKVEGEDVFVRPKGNDSQALSKYKVKDVNRYFTVGEHVLVISGKHQGATGMIVDIEENSVIVLSDTTREDIRVLRDCIAESFDVASVISKLGEYALDDLVLLDKTTVGVIVRLASEDFQILKGNPNRVEVITLKQRDIVKRINDRQGVVQDSNMNIINITNMVRVIEGPHKGKKGRVEHIYGNVIFLRDSHYLENAGLLCVRASSCTTLGGFGSTKTQVDLGGRKSLDQTEKRSFHNSRSSFQGREGGWRREDDLKGKTAIIKVGSFKGYRGRVVNTKDTSVLIYLESQMRVVKVHQHELSVIGVQPVVGTFSACGLESGNRNSSLNEDNTYSNTNGNNNWGNDDDGWGSSAVQKNGEDWENNQELQQNGWGSSAAQKNENDWGNNQESQQDGWGSSAAQKNENDWGNNQESQQDGWGSSAAQKNENDWGNNQESQQDGWGSSAAQKNENDWGNNQESQQDGWGSSTAQKNENDWGNNQESQQDGWNNVSCIKENGSVDGGASIKKNVWGNVVGPKEDDGWGSATASKDGWSKGDTNKNSSDMANDGALKDNNGWGSSAAQDGWGNGDTCKNNSWGAQKHNIAAQKHNNDLGNNEDADEDSCIKEKISGDVNGSKEIKAWGSCVAPKEDGWGSAAASKHGSDSGAPKKDEWGGVAAVNDGFESTAPEKDENGWDKNHETEDKWKDHSCSRKNESGDDGAWEKEVSDKGEPKNDGSGGLSASKDDGGSQRSGHDEELKKEESMWQQSMGSQQSIRES